MPLRPCFSRYYNQKKLYSPLLSCLKIAISAHETFHNRFKFALKFRKIIRLLNI